MGSCNPLIRLRARGRLRGGVKGVLGLGIGDHSAVPGTAWAGGLLGGGVTGANLCLRGTTGRLGGVGEGARKEGPR